MGKIKFPKAELSTSITTTTAVGTNVTTMHMHVVDGFIVRMRPHAAGFAMGGLDTIVVLSELTMKQ